MSDDEEPLGRPFLGRSMARVTSPSPEDGERGARPYLVTAGRTRAATELALETLVRTTPRGRMAQAAFEHARVLVLAEDVQSIVEVAARLHVPVGVARVVVGDLAAAGLVEVCAAPALHDLGQDPEFLERLMHGVAAL